MHYKNECFIYIRNSKQALSQRFALKEVHRIIKFNQKSSLKPFTDINK